MSMKKEQLAIDIVGLAGACLYALDCIEAELVNIKISGIIDYVANPQKTDNGRLITGFACDSRTVDAEFLLAKRQYMMRFRV